MKYAADELHALPTLKCGHFDDLKLDTEHYQVWLSRSTCGEYLECSQPAQSIRCEIVTVVFKSGAPKYIYIAKCNDGLMFLRQQVLRKIAEYEGDDAVFTTPPQTHHAATLFIQ